MRIKEQGRLVPFLPDVTSGLLSACGAISLGPPTDPVIEFMMWAGCPHSLRKHDGAAESVRREYYQTIC